MRSLFPGCIASGKLVAAVFPADGGTSKEQFVWNVGFDPFYGVDGELAGGRRLVSWPVLRLHRHVWCLEGSASVLFP